MFVDPESGISVSVNPEAIESQEQADAISDFMKTLAGIPTQKEMETWFEGYDDFTSVLNTLKEIDREIRDTCKRLKKWDVGDKKVYSIRMNLTGIDYEAVREIETREEYLKIEFKVKE